MKAPTLHLCFIFTITLLFSPYANGQDAIKSFTDRYEQFSNYSSPEKLYIHTDKDIYSTGEHIWLKGYLQNKSYVSELPESRFIYVELYSPDSLVSRIMLKNDEEKGFQGHIELPYSLPSGDYTLRGYSHWMAETQSDFLFHKQLHIISGKDSNDTKYPIDNTQKTLAELAFFPESGRYLVGIPSTIAFKANDKLGRGVEVTGKIFEEGGSSVAEFSTIHAGMGTINFTPESGKRYYGIAKDITGIELKVNLPDPETSAAVINLTQTQGKLTLYCHLAENLLSQNLLLIMHNGSQIFYHQPLENVFLRKTIPANSLEPGINHILIVNKSGQVLAERMFFVHPSYTVSANLQTKQKEYGKREKVELTLELSDEQGLPIEGSFSLSVTDLYTVTRDAFIETLPSYILLTSELNGAIEDPGYYFSPEVDKDKKEKAIDLLMLVQGWRYYDMTKLLAGNLSTPLVEKEYDQQISGKVTAVNSPLLNKKNISISIAAPSIGLYLAENLDGNKRFLVRDIDFPDGTEFMLSGSNAKDKMTNLNVAMDKDNIPKLTPPAWITYKSQANSSEWQQAMNQYYELADYMYSTSGQESHYMMEESRIIANYIYRPRHNPSPYNQTFHRNQIKERRDLEPFDDQNLAMYLRYHYPSMLAGATGRGANNNNEYDVVGPQTADGTNDPNVNKIFSHPPKMFVNFAEFELERIDEFRSMRVSDIETLVVLKPQDPSAILYGMNTFGGVILITTRRTYKQEMGNTAQVTFFKPQGWQKPAAFFSPNYELQNDKQNAPTDLRTTLLWEPCLTTDENGKANITFYTADRTTRFRFVVEGIADNGEYVSTVNVLE